MRGVAANFGRRFTTVFEVKDFAANIGAIERSVDGERLAKFAWAAGEIVQPFALAVLLHLLDPAHWLHGSDQHRAG